MFINSLRYTKLSIMLVFVVPLTTHLICADVDHLSDKLEINTTELVYLRANELKDMLNTRLEVLGKDPVNLDNCQTQKEYVEVLKNEVQTIITNFVDYSIYSATKFNSWFALSNKWVWEENQWTLCRPDDFPYFSKYSILDVLDLPYSISTKSVSNEWYGWEIGVFTEYMVSTTMVTEVYTNTFFDYTPLYALEDRITKEDEQTCPNIDDIALYGYEGMKSILNALQWTAQEYSINAVKKYPATPQIIVSTGASMSSLSYDKPFGVLWAYCSAVNTNTGEEEIWNPTTADCPPNISDSLESTKGQMPLVEEAVQGATEFDFENGYAISSPARIMKSSARRFVTCSITKDELDYEYSASTAYQNYWRVERKMRCSVVDDSYYTTGTIEVALYCADYSALIDVYCRKHVSKGEPHAWDRYNGFAFNQTSWSINYAVGDCLDCNGGDLDYGYLELNSIGIPIIKLQRNKLYADIPSAWTELPSEKSYWHYENSLQMHGLSHSPQITIDIASPIPSDSSINDISLPNIKTNLQCNSTRSPASCPANRKTKTLLQKSWQSKGTYEIEYLDKILIKWTFEN